MTLWKKRKFTAGQLVLKMATRCSGHPSTARIDEHVQERVLTGSWLTTDQLSKKWQVIFELGSVNFLVKNGSTAQVLYLPDLTPCDFFLFPRLKREIKGFDNIKEIKIKVSCKPFLKMTTKNSPDSREIFHRFYWCVSGTLLLMI